MKPRLLTIVGPTATGKSSLGITLAQTLNGEIISADSRQVYQGFDIGSGKVNSEEMNGVPHHLLDIVPAWEDYSVQAWKESAETIIQDLCAQNILPIVVGGTGLYTESLTKGFQIPEIAPNPALRKKLEQKTVEQLQAQLTILAPGLELNQSDRNNPVRLIRAIEKAMAGITNAPEVKSESPYNVIQIGLTTSPERLQERISQRVDARLENGAIEEVQGLYTELTDRLGPALGLKKLKSFGLGTVTMLDYIHERLSWEDMRTKFITKEYQYAKRQLTWFQRDSSIHWFEADTVTPKEVRKLIEEIWSETE